MQTPKHSHRSHAAHPKVRKNYKNSQAPHSGHSASLYAPNINIRPKNLNLIVQPGKVNVSLKEDFGVLENKDLPKIDYSKNFPAIKKIDHRKNNLREEFIIEFVRAIISEVARKDAQRQNLISLTIPAEKITGAYKNRISPQRNHMLEPIHLQHSIMPPKSAQILKLTPSLNNEEIQPVENELQVPQPSIPSSSMEELRILAMGKLQKYMQDNSIQSIECPGPDRPLIIHKSGLTQILSLALGEVEIDAIMQEVSQKTRIPVIPGIFRAALTNYIITAVISEFVGTRFIIQKQRLPRPQGFQRF